MQQQNGALRRLSKKQRLYWPTREEDSQAQRPTEFVDLEQVLFNRRPSGISFSTYKTRKMKPTFFLAHCLNHRIHRMWKCFQNSKVCRYMEKHPSRQAKSGQLVNLHMSSHTRTHTHSFCLGVSDPKSIPLGFGCGCSPAYQPSSPPDLSKFGPSLGSFTFWTYHFFSHSVMK